MPNSFFETCYLLYVHSFSKGVRQVLLALILEHLIVSIRKWNFFWELQTVNTDRKCHTLVLHGCVSQETQKYVHTVLSKGERIMLCEIYFLFWCESKSYNFYSRNLERNSKVIKLLRLYNYHLIKTYPPVTTRTMNFIVIWLSWKNIFEA